MSALFSRPKPPKVTLPAKEAPDVQDAAAEVKRRERARGRQSTILTNPLGVSNVAPAHKRLTGQ